MELEQMHKKFAVDCFNGTWNLIEKPDRTPEETHKMIAMAYASLYHWSEVGTTINLVRGHWQVSRVWAVAAEGENALRHARACLGLCEEHGIGGFDLAFAYEALARASALLSDTKAKGFYLGEAWEAAQKIADAKEKEYLLSELETI